MRENMSPHRLQQVQHGHGGHDDHDNDGHRGHNHIIIMMNLLIIIILLSRDEFPKEYVPTVFENYVTDIEVFFVTSHCGYDDYDPVVDEHHVPEI